VQHADLSEGERQLLCLTRALVARGGRRALRVLLCDEPTSNVDFASDARAHEALLALDCTVLVNAHRLQHISRFEHVCVMDRGQLVEQGAPEALLAQPGSRLAAMYARARRADDAPASP
jgi:ABC-type multidrug transport system fused ATPase/permease subunit